MVRATTFAVLASLAVCAGGGCGAFGICTDKKWTERPMVQGASSQQSASVAPGNLASLGPPTVGPVMGWPRDWAKHLGQTVSVDGKAVNCKIGPALESGSRMIWIDGLYWPEGFYSS